MRPRPVHEGRGGRVAVRGGAPGEGFLPPAPKSFGCARGDCDPLGVNLGGVVSTWGVSGDAAGVVAPWLLDAAVASGVVASGVVASGPTTGSLVTAGVDSPFWARASGLRET